jgi:hypothetical protein
MAPPIQIIRPHRRIQSSHEVTRPAILPRIVGRSDVAVPSRRQVIESRPLQPATGFQTDPYLDYGRVLTPEGGILIVYKDHDLRLRHTIWRMLAWVAATGYEAIFLLHRSSLHSPWMGIACLVLMAIINWLIVAKPVEIYRKIEIRPDCMILDGAEIFWRALMENGMPTFRRDQEGHQALCGIYGTRFVTYLTARRFDANDRMPEVIGGHIRDAMMQLWTKPQL